MTTARIDADAVTLNPADAFLMPSADRRIGVHGEFLRSECLAALRAAIEAELEG